MKRVVIVGGGIAGLAAAHRLARETRGAAVTLIESETRLGGKILTERVGGFVLEGGPDSFLSAKPRGLGLCRELGLADRLLGTNEKLRRTYVLRGGQLYDLPEGLSGLVPSRLGPIARSGLLSPWGKLRMAGEYLVPPRPEDGDESVAAFVQRRLGLEAYERLIEPLLSGIYAGDGAELSLAATFPQLRQTELASGGLIKGMLAARRSAPAPGKAGTAARAAKLPAFLTAPTGLAEIVEALEARLTGVEILRGVSVTGLERAAPGYRLSLSNGETRAAEAVIFATPAYVSADLLGPLDMLLAVALRGIPYISTATVYLAYPQADLARPLDGYGYIIPRAEGRPILACTWTSSKFAGRAPEGFGLIRVFIGRAGQPDVLERDDAALVALAAAELEGTLGIRAAPAFQRVFRWPRAMPQYTLGHLERVAAIDERLAALPGLYVAGNAYRGVGLPDCIASGEAAAQAAARVN
jgi:protoporphyrinogen/coproporphyrinogen III oxidase